MNKFNELDIQDGKVELQLEDPRSNPPPDLEEIGKKFIPIEWFQIRFLRDFTMQIKTSENGEWQTVFKPEGHNHKYDYKPT